MQETDVECEFIPRENNLPRLLVTIRRDDVSGDFASKLKLVAKVMREHHIIPYISSFQTVLTTAKQMEKRDMLYREVMEQMERGPLR